MYVFPGSFFVYYFNYFDFRVCIDIQETWNTIHVYQLVNSNLKVQFDCYTFGIGNTVLTYRNCNRTLQAYFSAALQRVNKL